MSLKLIYFCLSDRDVLVRENNSYWGFIFNANWKEIELHGNMKTYLMKWKYTCIMSVRILFDNKLFFWKSVLIGVLIMEKQQIK